MRGRDFICAAIALLVVESCAPHDGKGDDANFRKSIDGDVKRFVEAFDKDGDKKLSYGEFKVSYEKYSIGSTPEQSKEAFDVYDGNGDGHIEVEEMVAFGERALKKSSDYKGR